MFDERLQHLVYNSRSSTGACSALPDVIVTVSQRYYRRVARRLKQLHRRDRNRGWWYQLCIVQQDLRRRRRCNSLPTELETVAALHHVLPDGKKTYTGLVATNADGTNSEKSTTGAPTQKPDG